MTVMNLASISIFDTFTRLNTNVLPAPVSAFFACPRHCGFHKCAELGVGVLTQYEQFLPRNHMHEDRNA